MTVSAGRHIILCADDYGISPAVSAAIRDLIGRRRINATSAMVVAPSFSGAEADTLRAAAHHAAIGLHLTLTAPFSPLSPGFAPLRDSAFLPLAAMAGRGLARMLTPALLEAEIAARSRHSAPRSAVRPTTSTAISTSTCSADRRSTYSRRKRSGAASMAAPVRPRGAAQSRAERAYPRRTEQAFQEARGAGGPTDQCGLRRHL